MLHSHHHHLLGHQVWVYPLHVLPRLASLVFNDASSSPRSEKVKKKKKKNRHQSRFYDQFSAFTRVTNSSHAHHPRTGSIASTFIRCHSRAEDCRRDQNQNGDHHLQRQQPTSTRQTSPSPPWSRSFEGRMSSRLDRNAHFLCLRHATKDQMALNLLSGVIPLEASHYNKLKRHAQKLRALPERKDSLKRRKQLLVRQQRGGFLPFLAALAPLAINLYSKLFK